MDIVTLLVSGLVNFHAPSLCDFETGCPSRQDFTWPNEFETVAQCQADRERRIDWLQKQYKFTYHETPDYICFVQEVAQLRSANLESE